MLGSGILGLICHVSRKPSIIAAQDWLSHLRDSGVEIAIPEIADYAVRRELIWINGASN
jgi:hypothetical protein